MFQASPTIAPFLRRRQLLRFLFLASSLYLVFWFWLPCLERLKTTEWMRHRAEARPQPKLNHSAPKNHPIDNLIRDANARLDNLLEKRSFTLQESAARYRERRGRHPPPGFDQWFAQALKDEAIVVEEFFDRIHHDINPFWAVDPRELRTQANTHPQVIRVRNGQVKFETDDPDRVPWINLWAKLVEDMMPHLPDLDMPINVMDEPRVLVPWDQINEYVGTERANRRLLDPQNTTNTFGTFKHVAEPKEHLHDPGWITNDAHRYWDHVRATCSPDDPSRTVSSLDSFDGPVDFPTEPMRYMFHGYVQNFSQAQNPCTQPHLRGMHGAFVESISMSTTHSLFPLFGGSKMPQNNELLIPGAMYLSPREFYNGGEDHGPAWADKKDGLIWRGTASGGRNKHDNWWHFHRHRWVQMMNASVLTAMERGDPTAAKTFKLPPRERYAVKAQADGRLGEWLSPLSDAAFVHLECFPAVEDRVGTWPFGHDEVRKTCAYTSPFMEVRPSLPMKEQYGYKFLPDVDGNSFSGRWRAFLQSTSLPLKATIYTEWHDDRLVPWVHFVPFDNTYQDIYGVLDYFLARDDEAEAIAGQGKDWAERVLRRQDMKLYVWRLLLEYARVLDDARDNLAFVGDLLK
ncbi:Beta-1,2-xylosyltransferase 1 [Metarhizium brunneum]|uniref:Beta-1,2-xylosyltransferase 1 n=1 Tax=Metarhizium brunneum TaxID=500148 RepID=A0A7D5Z172_9HYPO